MAYISRLSQLRRAIRQNPNAIIISERSIWTDRHVFAKMLYNDGKISKLNYNIYLKWFDEFAAELHKVGIIYLKTTPETCLKRIKIRARRGEKIPLAYSARCHKYHEEWLSGTAADILVIDGEVEYTETVPQLWYKSLTEFIKKKIPKLQVQISSEKFYCGC
jgi:deoxyadenosine/deoxycytidine kinase